MTEEIHVESCRHHRHAGACFAAVPLAWTAAVVVEHASGLNVAERLNFSERHGLTVRQARDTKPGASEEGNPDANGVISSTADSASRLLPNSDTHSDADPHGGSNHNPNPIANAGSVADTFP